MLYIRASNYSRRNIDDGVSLYGVEKGGGGDREWRKFVIINMRAWKEFHVSIAGDI